MLQYNGDVAMLIKAVMRNRIRSDLDSFGSVDPDPDSESGSRGIKLREKQSLN